MGNSASTVTKKTLLMVSQSVESYVEGKIIELTVDGFDKLTNIITAYIKGQIGNYFANNDYYDDHDNDADELLNKFIKSLEALNTSTIASPCHSELIRDADIIKDIRFIQLKQQYFDIVLVLTLRWHLVNKDQPRYVATRQMDRYLHHVKYL